MSTIAIILAAGKSTRLKSSRPKALHEVCGKPLLHHSLQACYDAGCRRVLVVVGHGREQVQMAFADDDRITWVEQAEQLGTGHAARVCEEELRGQQGDVFILVGDAPLIRPEVLRSLLDAHRSDHAAATMATAMLDDPTGYGRIVRDESGEFVEIVEQPDATPEQREIREVFPSYYCVRIPDLLDALPRLNNDNVKGEYYLPEIFAILHKDGKKVVAVQAVAAEDVLGINTRQQLAEVDQIMQDRIHRRVRDGGVTIVSSDTTYIEAGVTVGQDTVIRPFTFIGRDASIGQDCTIGPFAVIPREAIVPEGTTIAGNVTPENALLESGI